MFTECSFIKPRKFIPKLDRVFVFVKNAICVYCFTVVFC